MLGWSLAFVSNRRHPAPSPIPPAKAGPPAREIGWLPDWVYTGGRFETGLAFFADARGKITRFTREPADLAVARRLSGQAALPGLINGHAQSWRRVLRGRLDPAERSSVAARLDPAGLYDAVRMAFVEMLLHGITCVAEFHTLLHRPDGAPWPEPNLPDQAILRAARDTGIRLALFKVADAHADSDLRPGAAPPCSVTADPDRFLHDLDTLCEQVAREYPGDDTWVGVGVRSPRSLPREYLQAVGAHAHARRLRLHIPLAGRTAPAAARLAEAGLIDKRFTAVHAAGLTDEDIQILGPARAAVCVCPTAARLRGDPPAPADRLLAAGAEIALGADVQLHSDLLEEARWLGMHTAEGPEPPAPLDAAARFHAATVAGARSLGAPSGALEIGRPADFFTINLYDPTLAGVAPDTLLAGLLQALERRAVREVWVGARPCVANGRHPYQGAVVNRFVELQQRLRGVAPPA